MVSSNLKLDTSIGRNNALLFIIIIMLLGMAYVAAPQIMDL